MRVLSSKENIRFWRAQTVLILEYRCLCMPQSENGYQHIPTCFVLQRETLSFMQCLMPALPSHASLSARIDFPRVTQRVFSSPHRGKYPFPTQHTTSSMLSLCVSHRVHPEIQLNTGSNSLESLLSVAAKRCRSPRVRLDPRTSKTMLAGEETCINCNLSAIWGMGIIISQRVCWTIGRQ